MPIEYELIPGQSLGPFALGSSLWTVLELLRNSKATYPQVEIKYDPEISVTSPVMVHVKPYIDLLFSGTHQRLHTISLRRLRARNAGMGVPFTLRYKDAVLTSPEHILRKLGVTRTFGPTYPGEVLRYPGVIFGFHEDGEELSKGLKSNSGDDRTFEVKRIVVCQKAKENDHDAVLDEVLECPPMHGDIRKAVVKIHEGITMFFYPLTKNEVHVRLGTTTAEDLTCSLGPPLRAHHKEDDRMKIHSTSQSVNDDEEVDYFYNYFQYGVDFLISGITHEVKKIIIHSNVPGSPAFQRYMRCPWEIHGSEEVYFYDKIDKFSRVLNSVNASSAIPSSMELDRIDDERLCFPGSKTQLIGFDGAVCEVFVADIITLMIF